ncbi:MAG: hypothetical protein LBU64_08160 [Planctomycetota bacterium]|jgi:hypothetical protein|nr:hypothetical protein [Planctomycetota bacterium]
MEQMMGFDTGYAKFTGEDREDNARRAVAKLRGDFQGLKPISVFFFAATNYDPLVLAREFKTAFPSAQTWGCASGGELTKGAMRRQTVTAMAFGPDDLEMIEVVSASGCDRDKAAADRLFAEMAGRTGLNMGDLDFREYVGFLLLDGLAKYNDQLVERMGELTDVIIGGGCASDDGLFRKTPVFHDGAALDNGAVFALMKPSRGFAFLKTQNVEPTGKSLVATWADSNQRIIWEFDEKPALPAFAEAIGFNLINGDFDQKEKSVHELLHNVFSKNRLAAEPESVAREGITVDALVEKMIEWPLALIIGGEPYIRVAVAAAENGGIRTYLPPIEGLRYSITRTTNLIESTRNALDRKRRELGSLSAVMGCNCMLRQMIAHTQNSVREYGELFKDVNAAILDSYGEVYVSVFSQSTSLILFA